MQVKIIIGTIAFMLTMIILGFAALREPARLTAFALAEEGRAIENGARIYYGNCATCHGFDGKAEQCVDAAGEPIACRGLPLNSYFLLCGDRSQRLEIMNWGGTKRTFVETTVAAGRPGTLMPTWSEEFGGPMRDDQVQNATSFVLNWESEELCANPPPEYDWAEDVEEELAKHDPGDPARGEELYTSYTCIVCHGDLADESSATIGPWLGDIAEQGAERVPGQSAAQYVYHSILYPNDFIAPDCPTGPCAGPPSAMRQTFAFDMADSPQDMSDILVYLLGE